jgi:uncharacterized damage-inducible protein DinB
MRIFVFSLFAMSACLTAQDNPLSSVMKMEYGIAKSNILKSADKMPDAEYGFKATADVRSFGQIIGHVADAQYTFCSAAAGEKNPSTESIEKTKTTKAALVQALKDAFAYCDKVYDAMTDAQAPQMIKFFGRDSPKLGILAFNNMHDMEHYGNIVTYMRLKNIVPPSSEPRPQAPPPTPTNK